MPRAPKGIHMGSGWDQFFVDDSRQAEFEQTIDMIIGFQGTSQWDRHINWDLESYAYLNIMSETNVSYAVHQNDTDGEALWLPFDQQPDGTYARRSQDLRSQVYRDGFIERCKDIMRDGAAGVFFDDVNVDWGRMFRRTSLAPPASGADPLMSLNSEYYEPAPGETYKNLLRSRAGTNLSLYWTLGGTLEAEDQSNQNRDGIPAGAIEFATINQDDGPLEYDDEGATDFNGVGNRVESTFAAFANGVNRTFMGWAWRDTNDTTDDIFGGDGGTDRPRFTLQPNTQDVAWFPQTGQPGVTWAAAWPGNAQWVFWVLLFNETGDTAELFINNVSQGSQALTTQYAAAPGNFKIGATGPSNSGVFDGRMAHVAVMNQLLTPAEITEIWDAAKNEQPSHTGWPALLGDFLHYVIDRVRTDPDGFPEAKFIFNPFWSQLTPLRWNDPRTGHMVDACDWCIIEHGHSDSGLVDAAPGVIEFSHFALRSQLMWIDFIHSRGKNYILYANSDDGPGWAEYEMAAFMSKYEPGDVVVIWGEDYLWPDYNPIFDTDYGQRTHYLDSNVTGGAVLAGFAEGRIEYIPGHPELGATFDDEPLPKPVPGAIGFSGSSASHLIYSRGDADATGALTFAALVRRKGIPSGTPKIFSLSSTGIFSSSGGKGGLALVNDDGDVVRLDAGGGGTWDTDVDVPFDEWCIIAATKPEGSSFGTMHCYPLTQSAPRANLATNPKAGGLQTNGWTPLGGVPIFAAVTLGAGGAPAASAELTGLGITTAFHLVGDGDNDRAELNFPVVNGKHYRIALYVYLDSATAQGCRVNILNTANTVKLSAPTAVFSTLDTWTRFDTGDFVADETSATWKIRFRQSGAGAVDFYYTAVLIDEDDQVIDVLESYYDGDRDGFEWTGTAQQSSSRAVQITPLEWQHDNGGGWASRTNIEGWDRLVVGGWHGISDWFKGDIALMGIWDEQLGKSQIESLSANLSSQDWWDAAKVKPAMLLEGRHAGEAGLTTVPFVDLAGTSEQTFGQGTTQTVDGPPGWDYGAVLRPTAETLVGTLADDFHRGEFALEEKIHNQLATARRTNPEFPPQLANDGDQTSFWESDVAPIYNRVKNPKLANNIVAWSISNSSGFTITEAGARTALPVAAGEGFGWRTAVTNPDATARNAGLITPTAVADKPVIEPGEIYTMIAEAWVESIVGAPKLRLRQIVYDAAAVNVQDQSTDFTIPGTGWMRSARKFTAPATAANMRFAAQWNFPTGSTGASIDGYLTNFMLLKGDWTGVLHAYRDGDSVDGFWLGVANESDSVRPEWWQVELPTFEPITSVDVHWGDRRASIFEIWSSLDGETWDSQFKGVSEPGKQRIEIGLERARFLRIVPYETVLGRDPVRIYEVRAFGAKGSPPNYLNFGPNDVVVKRDKLQISDVGVGTSATVVIMDKTLRDIEITGRFSFGPTGSRRQLVWKRHSIDVAKALTLRLLSDGEFRLLSVDAAGVETSLQLYSGNTILPEEGDHVWLRARQEGDTALLQLFIDDPFLGALPSCEFEHTLDPGNRSDFGAFREGMFGVRLYDGDTTETGLETLVVSGLTPEQPTGVTFTPIFIPSVLWKFILAESDTMKHLADVSYGRNKHLDVINNKAGACNFVVPVDNDDWAEIEEGRHCIIAYRKGEDIWSGPIWNLKDDLPENQLAVSAVGWYETLVGRGLRKDLTIGTPAVPVIPGEMGLRLLDEINEHQRQYWGFPSIINANPLMQTFEGVLTTPPWTTTTGAPDSVDGTLKIPGEAPGGPARIETARTYNLTDLVLHAGLLPPQGTGTINGVFEFVYFTRDVPSEEFYMLEVTYDSSTNIQLRFYRTKFGGALTQIGATATFPMAQPLFLRIRHDSHSDPDAHHIYGEYSFNNVDWIQVGTEESFPAQGILVNDGGVFMGAHSGSDGFAAVVDFVRLGIEDKLQPSYITRGIQGDTSAGRWRSFKKGDGIQPLFTQMVDLENGFDFTIDPLTREMHTLPGSLQPGDPRIKDDVIFAYNWGPSNILKFGREGDFSVARNRINAQGKYRSSIGEDIAAQNDFFVMEEWAQLSEVVDPNVLNTYTAAEIYFRARPRKIVSFIPFPWNEENSVPEPFVDYLPGDRVRVSAKYGKRINIDRLPVRIFGISVDIDDNGNERISSLQVSP